MGLNRFSSPVSATALLIIILLTILCLAIVNARWRAAAWNQNPYDANIICRRARASGSRQPQQHKLCQKEPEIVQVISSGLTMAVDECQERFRFSRWNCSTEKGSFGKLMTSATRESGIFRAIISAGIVQSIAEACSAARLLACACGGQATEDRIPDDGQWVWSGCNDDVAFAYAKAKDFSDEVKQRSRTSASDFRMMIHLHNNEAGRLSTRNYMRRSCKCHGLSGSCGLQTCWLRMPSFEDVGQRLKERYDGAVQVTVGNPEGSLMTPAAGLSFKDPESEDIVFSQHSPNYCRPNPADGVLGTKGRICDPRNIGVGGCDILCCGRGYRTKRVKVVSYCRCKFFWCCEVKCDSCKRTQIVYSCK